MAKTSGPEPLLAALERSNSLEDLQQASLAVRDHFGLDHIAYHWVDSGGDQYGCGSYSEAWQARYIEQNYLRIDPVIQGCYQRFHPVDWKQLDWSAKAARAFQTEAMEYGLGNQGFSIPVRGPNGQFALFTVNHSCDDAGWAAFTDENRNTLILLAYMFNERALLLEPGRMPEPARSLSPREVDAMTLLAVGLSRAQVAEELEISEHTLRVYIESARFKLGALNTTHAVARAMSRGLIVV
ncbi:MAG: LuxR family transcriptional regulator [Sulfitobacter sp.]|nr:LuxR family transcriptional regulator [Sulfitobacter sp.]